EEYIYRNIVKYTLKNYVINKYIYNKANKNVKSIIEANYTFKDNKYIFSNENISMEDTKMLMRYVLLKRGNVVWIDFGFNIGNEFGGMHPAVILKNFDKDLFVVPISSKKPIEYTRIEKDLDTGKITLEECEKQKSEITEIIELAKINGFRKMLRWARITRMKKVSILRLNFSGTIGTLDGNYMNIISNKIYLEFSNSVNKFL
ncbi:MAG: type II toxin-antitoxin system PemK/MazF family toxin, partial [Clostridia bacterium]